MKAHESRVYVISSRFIYPASQEKLCFGKYSGMAFVLLELGIQMSTLYRLQKSYTVIILRNIVEISRL